MNNVVPLSSKVFRQPPQNIDAEKALLGAVMMKSALLEKVDFLRPEHFVDPANAAVFDAMLRLSEQGKQPSPVTLKGIAESEPAIIAAGGMQYIAALAGSVVTVINAVEYGKLIYDLHLRRQVIALGDEMSSVAFDITPDDTAESLIDEYEGRFHALSETGSDDRLKTFADAVTEAMGAAEAAYKNKGALIGVTAGLFDLDRKLGGFHDSDLLILAGRPSMGKTALAITIAHNAAAYFQTTDRPEHRGKVVGFFSLEMSADQIASRYLAHAARVNSHNVRTGLISESDFGRLYEVSRDSSLPIYIDDTPGVSVGQVRSKLRRAANKARSKGKSGLGLIVIDYLQLMSAGRGHSGENRVQEVSAITRDLKGLAKELNIPIIALSQLSRAVEMREDKRPQLADLRESGSIEQDSDAVMFVYREQYYLERSEPQQRPDETDERFRQRRQVWDQAMTKAYNTAEVIIAKQRHGPIGSVRLHFDPSTTWFSDLAREVE